MELMRSLIGAQFVNDALLGSKLPVEKDNRKQPPNVPVWAIVLSSLLMKEPLELVKNKIDYREAGDIKGVTKEITETDIKAAAAMCQYAYFYLNPGQPDKPACVLIDGWTPMSHEEVNALVKPVKMDFKAETEFTRKASGFNSLLFCQKKGGTVQRYAYCTEGTDMKSVKDWFSNLSQGLIGLSPQYTKSVQNAKLLDQAIGGEYHRLLFIGHSLGGGLASNNALVTKTRHAITFNAAGLNVLRVGMTMLLNNPSQFIALEERKNRIHAYVLNGEIINMILSKIFQPAYGNRTILYPHRSSISPLARHAMTNFLTEWRIWWDDSAAVGDFGSVQAPHAVKNPYV